MGEDNGVVLRLVAVGRAVVIRDALMLEPLGRSGGRPRAMGGERRHVGEAGATKSNSARWCWSHGRCAARRCWLHQPAVRGWCVARRFLGHVDRVGLVCSGSVRYLGG
jgi:hypothetical protein